MWKLCIVSPIFFLIDMRCFFVVVFTCEGNTDIQCENSLALFFWDRTIKPASREKMLGKIVLMCWRKDCCHIILFWWFWKSFFFLLRPRNFKYIRRFVEPPYLHTCWHAKVHYETLICNVFLFVFMLDYKICCLLTFQKLVRESF